MLSAAKKITTQLVPVYREVQREFHKKHKENHTKMENFDRKRHWENIYQTKRPDEVSWFEPIPETSIGFLKHFNIPATAKIIDIGGGDSFLVDYLLDAGYQDVTVLDISESAIDRAKARLNTRADQVKWIPPLPRESLRVGL